MRRHLYVRVYLTIVLVMIASLVGAGIAGWLLDLGDPMGPHLHEIAEIAVEDLPEEPALAQVVLLDRAERLGLHLSLLDSRGEAIATTGGGPVRDLRLDRGDQRVHGEHGPLGRAFHLRDGRWLVVRSAAPPHEHLPSHGLMLLVVALVIGVGAWPLARGVTRRLVRLVDGVEAFGAGDLDRRVDVGGRDEVAALAQSFNRTADRIQALVDGQRRMLASASHELRSPLARLRLSAELLREADTEADRDAHLASAIRDIDELDQLVGDLLLAGRLEVMAPPDERVDLLGIAAEECARFEAELSGDPVEVRGDPRLLRLAVRNLLDNARRHGAPPVEVHLECTHEGVELSVTDGGDGVPESERQRIFEAFYRPAGHAEGRDGSAGIGLSLVARIARLHGGEARCEGARFTLSLPGAGLLAPQALEPSSD